MPPKQKKNNTNTNQEEEESFQAVILTDSFEEQFLPLSHELPRVKKKAVKKLVLYLY
jgi:translation initiation factor eIF-2B subunit epsilon